MLRDHVVCSCGRSACFFQPLGGSAPPAHFEGSEPLNGGMRLMLGICVFFLESVNVGVANRGTLSSAIDVRIWRACRRLRLGAAFACGVAARGRFDIFWRGMWLSPKSLAARAGADGGRTSTYVALSASIIKLVALIALCTCGDLLACRRS